MRFRNPEELAQQRDYRRSGGLDYHDVEARPDGLFIGNFRVHDESYRDHRLWPQGAPHTSAVRDPYYFPPRTRLHKCGCGAFFIAHWSTRICLACRNAKTLVKIRAYTAERAKVRAERRANPPTSRCENCAKPTPALRSTKRYCSNACRQADHRRTARYSAT